MKKSLVIFGTADIAQLAHFYFSSDSEYEVVAFTVDAAYWKETTFCDLPVIAFEEISKHHPPEQCEIFVALGYAKLNAVRKEKYLAAKALGYRVASFISSHATVLNDGRIGENCFILEDNTVQPFVTIGNNVTLWSGNHIGHHSTIKDHCFIASHVVVSGGVEIGEQCFIGVNATLRDHIKIGERCVIGAGALLLADAEPEGVYMKRRNESLESAKHEAKGNMSNKWQKLGQLYCPPGKSRHPKLLSHAANPLPVLLGDDVYRVFYSGRDDNNRSSVGAVDIDIVTRQVVLEHSQPFFEHGPEGSFYANGVSIGNCYEANGVRYMLFMGWQSPKDKHWRGDIGRLVVKPDMTLELASEVPLMGSDNTDPLSLSYPWVLKNETGRYSMWYGSVTNWDAGNGEMLAPIKFASSGDGENWVRKGLAIPFELGRAQAFSRPTVVGNAHNGYEMWFSYRGGSGEKYRIGYAVSKDGLAWTLALEETGIAVSVAGWDADMIEYPFVFDHKGQRYMLYNGNGYGKTGFGLAVLGT